MPTKKRLITAARTLFAKKGYDATSVKDISKAAHLNVSLVSYHFGGKEGLFKACLEQFGQERLETARQVLTPPDSIADMQTKLKEFLEKMILCQLDYPEVIQIIHREAHTNRSFMEPILKNFFLKTFLVLVDFIQIALQKQLIATWVNPTLCANYIFSTLLHLSRIEKINQKYFNLSIADSQYRHQAIDQIIRIYFEGLTPATPSTKRLEQ